MTILFGAPFPAPEPPVFPAAREGLKHTWTAWDGSVWDLSDFRGGVFLLADGLEGLDMPDFTNYTHGSPVVHGVEWDGWIATGRKVFWNIGVYMDPNRQPADWVRLYRAFRKTLRPGTTGVWTVELPTGEQRSITLRLGKASEPAGRDPSIACWRAFGVELFPEDPFWSAGVIVGSWVVGRQVPFYGFRGFGPPFYHSPASQLATATVSNPGDVEAYIEWTIIGPSTIATVGLDGEVTKVLFPVERGQRLVIDTDPLHLIAELDGADVFDRIDVGDWNTAPLPPGENVKLDLSMTGTGSIEARFKHHVLEAFG